MAKHDDILKKYGVTQVKKDTGSREAAPASAARTATHSVSVKSDDILAKYGVEQVRGREDNFDQWVKDSEDAIGTLTQYGGFTKNSEKRVYDLMASGSRFRNRYKNDKQATDYIDDVFNKLSQAEEYGRYLSRFESEDQYKDFLAQQKDYAEKSAYDLDTGKQEISDLDSQIQQIQRQWDADKNGILNTGGFDSPDYATYEQRKHGYQAQISELERLRSEKESYVSQAEQIQNAIALRGGYDSVKNREEGLAGWEAYQQDLEQKRAAALEAEADKSWYDYLFQDGQYMTDIPLASAFLQAQEGYRTADAMNRQPREDWDEEQQLNFGYLWNRDPAKAAQYAFAVNEELDKLAELQEREDIREYAAKNFGTGLLSTVGSVLVSPFAGTADLLSDLAALSSVGYIPKADGFVSPNEFAEEATGAISQTMNDWGTISEKVPVFGGKGLGDAYALGTSMARSRLSRAFGSGATLASYFGSSAAQGIDDAINRGMSGEQALVVGVLKGIAEGVPEMLSNVVFDDLGVANSPKQWLYNVFVKQGGSEALEEGATSLLNNVIDNIFMRGNNQFTDLKQAYLDAGDDEATANRKAWSQLIEDGIFDTVGGFASGSLMAIPQVGKITRYQNDLVKYGLQNADGTESRMIAEAYQKRIQNKEDLSFEELDRLAAALERDGVNVAQDGNAEEQQDRDGQSLSQPAAASSLYTREPLAGATGDGSAESETTPPALRATSPYTWEALAGAEAETASGKTRAREVTLEEITAGQKEGPSATIREAAERYGAQRGAVEAVYKDGQDVAAFEKAFDTAHRFGQDGGNIDALLESEAVNHVLTPSQIRLAYAIGADSLDVYHAGLTGMDIGELRTNRSNLSREQKAALWKGGRVDAQAVYEAGKATGFVKQENAGVVENDYARKLRRVSPRSYLETKRVAMDMGVAVEISDIADELNGTIRDGVIQVNPKAFLGQNRRTTLRRILAHEVSHRMKETALDSYLEYRNFAVQQLSKNGTLEETIRAYQEKYSGREKLTQEQAMDEIAADYTQFFVDHSEEFQKIVRKDLSWGQRIIEALKAVISRIRGSTQNSEIAGEYEKALQLWEKAYKDAKEAVKKAPVGGQGDGSTKKSISDLKKALESETNYSYEKVNWLSDMAVVTRQQLAIFYEAVAKISKRGYYCPTNADGLYIVDLGDVLVFTDADYDNPKIYRAIQFSDEYESNIQEYKERIIDEEGRTAGFGETLRIIEAVEGEGFLTEYTSPHGSTYEGKNRRGKGKNLKGSDSKSEVRRSSGGVKKYSVSGTDEILRKNQNYLELAKDPEANREKLQAMVDEKAIQWGALKDGNGAPKKFFHGTSGGGFAFFDTYSGNFGLFGIGSYFTEDRSVAESYTQKGKGSNPQVYSVYLKSENPIDMDADADIPKWSRAAEDASSYFRDCKTNEDCFKALKEYCADEEMYRYEAYEYITSVIQGMGYDGITHIGGGRYNSSDDTRHRVAIVFEPEQIRSSDPVTYDGKGAVIPVSERFSENADYRYSVAGTETILEEAMQRRLKEAADKYGTIPPGENPVRKVTVPKQTSEGKRASFTIRTALEAKITPEELVPKLTDEVLNGTFSDDVHTNKETIRKGEAWMAQFSTLEKALVSFQSDVKSGEFLNEESTMRGYILYNQLANAAATAETDAEKAEYTTKAVQVLTDVTNITRTSARMVQATRILKRMSPECKYISLERAVENLNDRIAKRYEDLKLEKGREKLEINKELAVQWMMYLNAGEQAKAADAEERLYKDLAKQVKRTFWDRWNAWRYLSMLGNPKTLVRNLVGNLAMAPLKFTKDKIAAGMEAAFIKDSAARTRSLGTTHTKKGNALRAYAKEDYERVSGQLHGSEKYSEFSNARLMQEIRDYKSKFQMKGLKHYQKAVDWVMNGNIIGDSAFMLHHYTTAFTNIAMAKGWTADRIKSGEIPQSKVDEVRAMAYRDAQKATFRDVNAFSAAVRKLRFKNNTRSGRVGNVILEGILPFRSTPANVLVRAVEYSPVELLFNATVGTYDVLKGKISASEYIDRFASGLTGTGVWALGMFLTGMGVLTGGSDDDDKERKGIQDYALNIGGKSFSLDWLSPAAIPLFMGVESYESVVNPLLNGKDFDLGAVLTSVSKSFQPILEMSCLSSINSLLDSLSYVEGADAAQLSYTFFAAPFLSYIGQVIPTFISQSAAITEKQGEKTFVSDIENQFTRNITYDIVKLAEKIPFANWRQVARVDAWGRVDDPTHWIESYLSPAYVNDIKVTEADREIDRLKTVFQKQIDSLEVQYRNADTETRLALRKEMNRLSDLMNISPKNANTKISNVRLTAAEYSVYATVKGQNNYSLATGVMESSAYQNLTDEEKSKVISYAYELADDRGKYESVGLEADGWTKDLMESTLEESVKAIFEHFESTKQSEAVEAGNAALRAAIRSGEDASAVFKDLQNAGKTLKEAQETARKEIKLMFLEDEIDATTAKNYYKKYGGKTGDEAVNLVNQLKWQKQYPDMEDVSPEQVETYNLLLKPQNVTPRVYYDALQYRKTLEGDVKNPTVAYIHRLSLTAKQKDALYLALGYAESGLSDTPWH